MAKELSININDKDKFLKVSKALANDVRIQIILLLSKNSYNVNDIAKELNLPLTTVSSNIKILEDADLIRIEEMKGKRGVMRLCSRKLEFLHLGLESDTPGINTQEIAYQIPIGSFTSFKASPTCGMADHRKFIIREDTPELFYAPVKNKAQLIWLKDGYLEYQIPNPLAFESSVTLDNLKAIELSLEICSEAPNYQNDWPSDISIYINDIDIATYHSSGDYGGRRGKLNPSWWSSSATQFGKLITLKTSENNTTLNDEVVSKINYLDILNVIQPFIKITFAIKESAKYKGGFNIFGRKFGDFPQDIVFKFIF